MARIFLPRRVNKLLNEIWFKQTGVYVVISLTMGWNGGSLSTHCHRGMGPEVNLPYLIPAHFHLGFYEYNLRLYSPAARPSHGKSKEKLNKLGRKFLS